MQYAGFIKLRMNQVEARRNKQTINTALFAEGLPDIFLEMFLSQICGDSKQLRPLMLKNLLVLATESDWALSTILGVEYINPLEEYCSKTQPCDVPIALPKLLIVIGIPYPSNRRLCVVVDFHSSIVFNPRRPPQNKVILARLCFSPHLEVSKTALNALKSQSRSELSVVIFLQKHKVPSVSTESSSEHVPFAGRLCGRLAEHVSEIRSLSTESSPSDATVSALSATPPEDSPCLTTM
ncbi:hypothetical protein BLNAU_19334 [Blattamonas nauphoetae]|uniref:Uncharacterized protein n=1 Tax=Blattamonas nauphoetae TaxID=2049346 RepID=A0ABQ9X1R0_9EUKA|nr:hypothetical protein BLNAU_19334 [Blattamonas nauphoetae]